MTTKKTVPETAIKIENAEVIKYNLLKPFEQQHNTTVQLDEKGKSVNGKFAITVLIAADAPGADAVAKAIGTNKSMSSEIRDGVAYHKITASTFFKPTVVDVAGQEIVAPDARIYAGDTMTVSMFVTPYETSYKGQKQKALNLNLVKILNHDTSNRTESEGGTTAAMIAALS